MQSWGRFFGIGAASAPDTARRARCTSQCSRRRCPRRSRRARCGQPRRSIPRDRTCSRSWRRRRGRTPQGHQGFSWNRKAPSLPLNHARSLTVADPTFREQAGSPLVVGRKIVPGPSLPTGSTAAGMEPGSRGTATGLWIVEVNRLGFPFGVLRARVNVAEGSGDLPSRVNTKPQGADQNIVPRYFRRFVITYAQPVWEIQL